MKSKAIFKRIMFLVLCIFMSVQTFAVASAEDSVEVYVSIPNGYDLGLAAEKITVTDADNDGKITINDALVIAHNQYCPDGYAYSEGQFGLKIDKLWGVENGDGFGYYVNNQMAMSLGDALKNGDHVYAFAYTDTVTFSDVYTFFSEFTKEVYVGEEYTLTLSALGFDENWNTVSSPVENATILFDGETSLTKTDKDGKVTFNPQKEGKIILSALCDDRTITPPVCIVTVKSKDDIAKPGDTSAAIFGILCVLSLSGIMFSLKRVRKNEE